MSEPNIVTRWKSWTPYFSSILRIVSGLMFMFPGTTKLFAFPIAVMPDGSTAAPMSLIGFAAILEVFGGLLLLLGLFTRPIAFLVCGEMAFAYFMGHASQSFWPVVNHGELAILFCFIWLYFSAAGAGPWSLDATLRRK